MMGITSLPGAQQNPGQAAMPQAIPAPQPKTPQAMTGQLQNLPPQQLMAMFANPTDSTPKWAVITAYAKAIEQQRLMQAAQGQNAMQQGQMQAGQPPVAMQVMAQGAEPQFSGGGAVSFAGGTGPQGLDTRQLYGSFDPVPSEEAFAMDALRVEEAKRKKRIKELEEQLGFLQSAGAPQAVSVAQELARLKGVAKNAVVPGVAMQIDPKNPLAIPSLEAALKDPGLGRVERLALQDTLAELYAARAGAPADTRAPSGSSPYATPLSTSRPAGGPGIAALPAAAAAAPVAGQGISSTLPSDIETAVRGRITQLEASKNLPPEVLEARKGLAALEASNIEAQRAATGAFGKESAETLEAARRARSASRLDDIQYLGQMLEGMRGAKRLGEGLAGVASGAGRAEAGRAAALKEAEKLRREDQRLIRAEETAGRQLQILAQQRRLAEADNDAGRVAKIDAEISQVKQNLANAKQTQAEKAAEFGLREREVGARERTAAAASQRQATPFEQFMANPEQYTRFIELSKGDPMAVSRARVQQAIAADPELKRLADLAAMAPNGPQAVAYRKRVEELTLRLAPELLIGGAAGAGSDLSAATEIARGGK